MIVFLKIAEFIFLVYTLIRTLVFGVWTIKNQNKKGGICILSICIAILSLFVLNLITDYR